MTQFVNPTDTVCKPHAAMLLHVRDGMILDQGGFFLFAESDQNPTEYSSEASTGWASNNAHPDHPSFL